MLPVFDGHNDALTRPDAERLADGRQDGHLDLPRMRRGNIRGGIFAIFTPGPEEEAEPQLITRPDGALETPYAEPVTQEHAAAHASVAAGRLLELEREGQVRIARRISDLDAALEAASGPPAAVLHLEGAEAIDPDLHALETWHAAGLRSLGLVWSRVNAFGAGVPFVFPSSPDTGPGLTEPGVRLARRCAELGVMVDLAHLNEAGFWDLARLELGPLVVSHAGVHALSPCSRNLTDAQLDAVRASGGLVGIVFACAFLRADFADDPAMPLSLIADHARYVADRIGPEHVALGSDFDGTVVPDAVRDAAGMQRVLEALADAGFTGSELEQVAHRNWRRVLDAWWKG